MRYLDWAHKYFNKTNKQLVITIRSYEFHPSIMTARHGDLAIL